MLNYLNLAISIERFQLLSQTPTELFKTRSRHLGKRYWRDLLDVYDSKCYEVKEQKIGIRHTPVSHVNFQITNLIFTSTVVANCVEKRDRLYWTCTFVENKKNWGKGICKCETLWWLQYMNTSVYNDVHTVRKLLNLTLTELKYIFT